MSEPLPSAFEQRWRKRFEEYAAEHDDDAGIAGWSPSGLQARLRHFDHAWRSTRPGGRWLDAGCGAGSYARLLDDRGMEVLGLDYSYPTLHKARERADSAKMLWAVGDATHLPLRPKQFDGALCFGVLQALSRPELALAELRACTKTGGEVWIDALNAYCLPTLLGKMRDRIVGRGMHLRYDSPWKLARAMRASGMRDVRLHWVPILPSRWAHHQHRLEGAAVRTLLHWIPPLGALLSHAFVLSGRRGDD